MDKLNYFKYFTNISHIFIKLYNNYELRHIIHSNIIFIINLLIKYEKKISIFFFDIDIQASNLLLIISFSISLLEILSTQKKIISLTLIMIMIALLYTVYTISLMIITFILLKKNQLWGWSFYLFLIIFFCIMTIDSIKFFLKNKNNNFENKEVEINILNKNEEIENICEDDGDKKKLKNKEIKNSLSENNDVISENNPKTDSDKIILLKNFKKENKFLNFNEIIDLILTKFHAILVFSINILLYFNENLYDFFLYDMNSFFWYILIIIIFVIFIA